MGEGYRKAVEAKRVANEAQSRADDAYDLACRLSNSLSLQQSEISRQQLEINQQYDQLQNQQLLINQAAEELLKLEKQITFIGRVLLHLPSNLACTAIKMVQATDLAEVERDAIVSEEQCERAALTQQYYKDGNDVRQQIIRDQQARQVLSAQETTERQAVGGLWLSELQKSLRNSEAFKAIKENFLHQGKYNIYQKLQSLEYSFDPIRSYNPLPCSNPLQQYPVAPGTTAPITWGWQSQVSSNSGWGFGVPTAYNGSMTLPMPGYR